MNLADKLLWDQPFSERTAMAGRLEKEPVRVLERHRELFIKVLNTLSWYDLIELFGAEKLDQMLTDDVISNIFPAKRRKYYENAHRLLSKYALPPAG